MASPVIKGISSRFLLENGRIKFTSGKSKAMDNLYFFMVFHSTPRIYLPEFTPDTNWMIQKPLSFVIELNSLFVGKLKGRINKFIPSIVVDKIDTIYQRGVSPSQYYIGVAYTYAGMDTVEKQTVIFI